MSRLQSKEIAPVEWLEEVLRASIVHRASDIHIEPERNNLVLRFRIDGVMRQMDKRHKAFQEIVMSRLKVLSRLNVIEKNVPQDGHLEALLQWKIEGGMSDNSAEGKQSRIANFRVSIMPTSYGEAAVLRTLNREDAVLDLENLGFSEKSLVTIKQILQHPHGIVLVTGPSGSGKTTTMYSLLSTYNSEENVILTLEDPIEYQLTGVRQTQVAPERGLSFGVGLKAILRQDPDVVMIGEIRDEESMEIAVRASLAGRLVYSTLHTNDIAGAIIRMLDMNIGRSRVASALTGIISQRLVRKVCEQCKTQVPVPKELTDILRVKWPTETMAHGRGCAICGGTGYYGRVGLFELLEINNDLRTMIIQHSSIGEIQEFIKNGIPETMRQDAFNKVLGGVSTLEEILKISI